MRKIIRIKPPIAVQCTHRYKFKGKTYIVQSSYWLPNKGAEGGADISYRLKDRIEYILAQDESIRDQLQRVRLVISKELPEATEKISWSTPTWWQGNNVIHFGAQKKHIGLYPGPEAVAFFTEKLEQAGCKYSKGSVQIPYSRDLPLELIAEIADWCRDTGNHA